MAELTPELAATAAAAIAQNAEEAAGAFGRAFGSDGEHVVRATPATTLGASAPSGAGLAFAFDFAGEGMIGLLPHASGLLPDWVRSPDPTGVSKLGALAQELSMLLLPDTLMADVFDAAWVEDLAAFAGRAQTAPDATALAVEVARGETLGVLTLAWPAPAAKSALAEPLPTKEEGPVADATPRDVAAAATPVQPTEEPERPQSRVLRMPAAASPRDFRDLPPHALSVLQVTVPLTVNLAGKKMKLRDVIEIGPGSILTFDKGCDAPLEVAVGDRPVATGEAVKVGERFGVRIVEMILPDEHFRPMLPASA